MELASVIFLCSMISKFRVMMLLFGVVLTGCRDGLPNALPERRVKVQTVERLDFIDKDFSFLMSVILSFS